MIGMVALMSSLAIAGGSFGFFVFEPSLKFGISQVIRLKPNGFVYSQFIDPPFQSDSVFYLHEITNPREVLSGGKAQFKLKGPYVGRTRIVRHNVSFTNNDEVLRYGAGRETKLDETKSADLDERFYVMNPIVPSVAMMVRQIVLDRIPFKRLAEPVVFNSVNALLDTYGERLLIKRSPRELLLGKRVDLLEMVVGVANRFGLGSLIPPGPPDNIFGLIHAQNSLVNPIAVYGGTGSTKEKFAEVAEWKGKKSVDVWKGRCSIISGTNGELYKPFLVKGKPLKIFLPDLCRSFNLEPVGDELKTEQGTRAYEYELSPQLYAGAKSNPNNECYCSNSRTYDCQYDGLISMGPCFFNTPLFFSRPNFKGVDRRIRSLVDEETLIQNIPDKQSFYIDPITAAVLKANLTLFGVFKVVRQPFMRDLAKIQNLTYMPFFTAYEKFADNHKIIFAGLIAGGSMLLVMRFWRSRATKGANQTATETAASSRD